MKKKNKTSKPIPTEQKSTQQEEKTLPRPEKRIAEDRLKR